MIYKEDSLNHLESWLTDALHSEATPKEVYTSILNAIDEEIDFHQSSLNRAKELRSMITGNPLYNSDIDEEDDLGSSDSAFHVSSKITEAKTDQEWKDFWNPAKDDESFKETLKREGYEYTPPSIPARY